MRKLSFVLGSLLILLAAAGMVQSAGWDKGFITIDQIQGLATGDTVLSGGNLRFVLRFRLDSTNSVGISNGFRIYSPDGATWDSTRADSLGYGAGDPTPGVAILGKTEFDLGLTLGNYSADGVESDTIGILGLKFQGIGLKGVYSDTAFAVTAFRVSSSSGVKQVCIDSSWFRPGGTWKWASTGAFARFATWNAAPRCFFVKGPLAVQEIGDGTLPREFSLGQNYPNPFNPTTNINFDVPSNSHVTLTIFNVLGQKVKTLVDKEMAANKYNVDWDGTSDAGTRAASGIYFYRMQAGDFAQTKKMIMIK